MMRTLITLMVSSLFLTACQSQNRKGEIVDVKLSAPEGKAIAAFAEGCFWCVEEIFEAVVGVDSAVSGYAGGTVAFPTYELVNTETTGHAETVLVYYDPNQVSYEELVNVFFQSHDPTTPNRQGPDRGSSYRSILFYLTDAEEAVAKERFDYYAGSGLFAKPIVTELKKLDAFYRAEAYHQDYIEHHPENPYVQNVSIPRFMRFQSTYQGKLKNH